jgi:nucleotide-binding universal stress UspA family protein
MPVKRWERVCLGVLAAVMVVIEITLVCEKPDARYFAAFVVGTGLAARYFTKTYPRLAARGRAMSLFAWTGILLIAATVIVHFEGAVAGALQANVAMFQHYQASAGPMVYVAGGILLMAAGASAIYGVNYLLGKLPAGAAATSLSALPVDAAAPVSGAAVDMSKPRVLVATRGGRPLIEFAANYCRKTGAALFVLFVRQVNVNLTGTVSAITLPEDPAAAEIFRSAQAFAEKQGVPMVPIYAVSQDVPYTILDFAVTYGVEAVLMGVSREAAFLRALRGDVLSAVADNLPPEIPLLIHA